VLYLLIHLHKYYSEFLWQFALFHDYISVRFNIIVAMHVVEQPPGNKKNNIKTAKFGPSVDDKMA
jgi:hypothetical protein